MMLPLPSRLDEGEFRQLVAAARCGPTSPEGVAQLAAHLAASGEQLTWQDPSNVADIASTGGPGSLSTLLAPLWLRSDGFRVAKLAVPGRPAGAIDTLGTIAGYRVHLSTEEVRAVMRNCGFAHFLADERFAPLDAALYRYRRQTEAVAIPALAAASLLAKKLAVGVHVVGLDVRIGTHGNFGSTREEARQNAKMFCQAARALGLKAVAFLGTDDALAQPWIGRGESLVALAYALGLRKIDDPYSWLDDHLRNCRRMAAITRADSPAAIPSSDPLTFRESVRKFFEAHLTAQGANEHAFLQRVDEILITPPSIIEAPSSGFLRVDLDALRTALLAAQDDEHTTSFRDPAGVRFLIRPGSRVSAGDPIATLRCTPHSLQDSLISRVKSTFQITPSTYADLHSQNADTMEVIHA